MTNDKMTREEAIETVRICCPRISDSECDFETAMRVLIPELTESEDERIRKFLVRIVNLCPEGSINIIGEVKKADVLAYLEKQKESLHIPETCKENADSFTDKDERIRKALLEVVSDIAGGWPFEKHRITKKEAIAYLEKQKERGPLTKEEEFTLQRIIEHLEDEGCPSEWKDLLHDIYNLPYTKQKEQMLKDAVEGEAHPDDCEIWVNFEGYGYKFNDGDKVKIVIVPIKEDKK